MPYHHPPHHLGRRPARIHRWSVCCATRCGPEAAVEVLPLKQVGQNVPIHMEQFFRSPRGDGGGGGGVGFKLECCLVGAPLRCCLVSPQRT